MQVAAHARAEKAKASPRSDGAARAAGSSTTTTPAPAAGKAAEAASVAHSGGHAAAVEEPDARLVSAYEATTRRWLLEIQDEHPDDTELQGEVNTTLAAGDAAVAAQRAASSAVRAFWQMAGVIDPLGWGPPYLDHHEPPPVSYTHLTLPTICSV